MSNYNLTRTYNETMTQLQTTDKVHANTFNPLFNQLLNNDANHKDRLDGHDTQLADFVNVRQYGAKIDGSTDDTQSLLNALADSDYVFIPKGTGNMIVNVSSTILLSGKTIAGEGIGITNIQQNGSVPLFKVGQYGSITNLTVWVSNSFTEPIIAMGYYNGTADAFTNTLLQNVRLRTLTEASGNHQGLSIVAQTIGGWRITLDNIDVRNCSTGITAISVNSNGWITHSVFKNLLVSGYSGRYAIKIAETSTDGTLGQLSYVTLDTSVVEAYWGLATLSSAFLLGGRYNTFSNLNNMMDVGTVGATNYGLEIYDDTTFTGTHTYNSTDCNKFENIRLEAPIQTNGLDYSNYFNNVKNVMGAGDQQLDNHYATSVLPSVIPEDLFNLSMRWVSGSQGGWTYNTSDNSLTPTNNTIANAIYLTLPPYAGNQLLSKGRWFTVNIYFNSSVAYDTGTVSYPAGNQDVSDVYVYNLSGTSYVLHGNVDMHNPNPWVNGGFVIQSSFNPVVADFKITKIELIPGKIRGQMPINYDTTLLNQGFEEIVSIPSGTTTYTYTVNALADMYMANFDPKYFEISQVDGNNLSYAVASNSSNLKQLIVTFSTATSATHSLRFRFRAYDHI